MWWTGHSLSSGLLGVNGNGCERPSRHRDCAGGDADFWGFTLTRAPVTDVQASGSLSLRSIAAGLNERGIPTARGGTWSAVQVKRVLERGAESRERHELCGPRNLTRGEVQHR